MAGCRRTPSASSDRSRFRAAGRARIAPLGIERRLPCCCGVPWMAGFQSPDRLHRVGCRQQTAKTQWPLVVPERPARWETAEAEHQRLDQTGSSRSDFWPPAATDPYGKLSIRVVTRYSARSEAAIGRFGASTLANSPMGSHANAWGGRCSCPPQRSLRELYRATPDNETTFTPTGGLAGESQFPT